MSALSERNVLISGGVREKNIVVEWAYTAQQIITNHTNNVSPGELEFLKILSNVDNPVTLFVIRPSN